MNSQSSLHDQKNAKTLSGQIAEKNWFQNLLDATKTRDHRQSLFDQSIPKEFLGKYHVLELQGTQLLIGTNNAGHATRMRYEAPHVVQTLQQHALFSLVKTLSCIVMPPSTPYVSEKRHAQPIPASAATFMKAVAATITDPDLKAAMLKLASNTHG
jgi:hypothetical protein